MIFLFCESFLVTLETPVGGQTLQLTISLGEQVLSAMLNWSGTGHVILNFTPSTHEKYFAQPDGSLRKPNPVSGQSVKAGKAITQLTKQTKVNTFSNTKISKKSFYIAI